MKMGIMTRNKGGWCSTQLRKAMEKKNITPFCFNYREITGRINYAPEASANKTDILQELDALITRPIARGSVEQLLFRMDFLHKLERQGLPVINPPLSIERAVNKYSSLSFLQENCLPVPRTAVTENPDEALNCFHELGGDVIVKPLFGSRGLGATRITDPDVAIRAFMTIAFYHGILYLQEFVPHGGSDIRAFVVGDRVVAAMRRTSANWKTNVSVGAKPVSINLSAGLESLAVRASKVVGCKVAGVDIIEGPDGPVVIELNSQPGWKGLQSVTEACIADEIVSYVVAEVKS